MSVCAFCVIYVSTQTKVLTHWCCRHVLCRVLQVIKFKKFAYVSSELCCVGCMALQGLQKDLAPPTLAAASCFVVTGQ